MNASIAILIAFLATGVASANAALAAPKECSNAFKRQWQADFNKRKMAASPCILSTDTGAYYCDNNGCSRCGPVVPLSKCGIKE